MMMLLAIAAGAIREWFRRAILDLPSTQPGSDRELPPEYFKFPCF
jgi:hypothetical protein